MLGSKGTKVKHKQKLRGGRGCWQWEGWWQRSEHNKKKAYSLGEGTAREDNMLGSIAMGMGVAVQEGSLPAHEGCQEGERSLLVLPQLG